MVNAAGAGSRPRRTIIDAGTASQLIASVRPTLRNRGSDVARTEPVQRIVARAFGAIWCPVRSLRSSGPRLCRPRLRGYGTIDIANRAGGVAVRVASPAFASELVRLRRARAFRRGDGTAGSWLRQECEPGLWSTRTAQRVRTNEREE